MGEISTFFFDTYAFYEIIEGNPKYSSFAQNIAIITTKLNLMELYYGLLIKHGQDTAEKYYDKLTEFTVDMDDETIKKAMLFRAQNKNKKFSYVDCIGYVLAIQRNVKFLTGDNAFMNLPNVEFVK